MSATQTCPVRARLPGVADEIDLGDCVVSVAGEDRVIPASDPAMPELQRKLMSMGFSKTQAIEASYTTRKH
jgi:hypothetical protein